jgi:formylglycine-generating enzyme required for sulfatase activity
MTTYRTVFISHAHTDNVLCERYATALKALGIDVWIDLHNLQNGHFLGQDIQEQIQHRTAFVLMMSPASLASFWVSLERDAYLGLMAADPRRMLLPVRIVPCTVPPFMNALKWIDATTLSFDQAVEQIARALQAPANPGPDVLPVFPSPSAPPVPSTWEEIAIPARLDQLGFQGWRDKKTGIAFIVPPVRPVAAGKFTMGSAENDPQAYDDEKGQYSIPVGAFEIGTFPVTVAEYALYLQANPKADKPRDYAFSKDADWVAPEWRGKTLTWAAQQQRADHPVVCITWADAYNYTQWLAQVTGQPWRLPTEAEWEKAARWDEAQQHARVYPWGDQWDKARANTREGGPGMTTPIGQYMDKDTSPYGCHDMAGNVWEWTSTLWYDRPPYDASKYENESDRTSARVLRGGSWNCDPRYARAAFRLWYAWINWVNCWGFRVARSRAGW